MNIEHLYKPDDVIWAKVRGYPWWPAVVKFKKIKKNPDLPNREP